MPNKSVWVAALALLGMAAAPAFAQLENFDPLPEVISGDSAARMRADVRRTDNALRTPANKQEDTLASLGLEGKYRRNGTKIDINASGDIDWVKYLDRSFGTEATGFADVLALYGNPTDLLQWVVHDNYAQLRQDPIANATPNNLGSVNNLVTGPALNFRIATQTRLKLYGLYTLTNDQQSRLDSKTREGGAALVRSISQQSSAALNVDTQSVDYDDVQATDYQRDEAYVRYSGGVGRTTLSGDLGYDRLRQLGDTNGGLLLRFDARRLVSGFSTIWLHVGQHFASAAQALADRPPVAAVGNGEGILIATTDPFRERTARLDWTTVHPRTTLSLAAFWTEESHETAQLLDRSYSGVTLAFARRLRPTVTLRVAGTYQKEHFDALAANSNDTNLLAEYENNFGRRYAFSLRYERFTRSGDQSQFNYTENRFGVRLLYRLFGTL